MSKELENLIELIIYLFIICTIIKLLWNWFLELLQTIGIWIYDNSILIITCVILFSIIPITLNFLTRTKSKNPPTNDIVPNRNLIELPEKQNDSFNKNQLQNNLTSKLTQDMIYIMNTMLKSKRHRRDNQELYQKTLQRNGRGYVYFILSPDKWIKIGMTANDPFKRMNEIFGGVNTSYEGVKFIHLIRTDFPFETEKAFHNHFAKKRHVNKYDPTEKNEFFNLEIDDLEWLKRQQYPEWIQKTIKY